MRTGSPAFDTNPRIMKTPPRIAALLLFAASLACAQSEAPQERAVLPEVQALWTPYQNSLKAVEFDRDQKLRQLDYIYMLNLDKMQKDRSAAGDLDGALAVKAELGRLGGRQETTAEQIKAMNPALQKLRAAYDTALKNYQGEAATSNAALLRKLLADLEEVQRRITTTGDLEKALLVKAEKERIAAEAAQARPAPAAPEVKVAPVPVSEPVKVPPVVSLPPMKFGTARTADATKERPFENGLGMKFVPVPITGGPSGGQRVLFSIWETRVKDYEAYAKAKGVKMDKLAVFKEGPTHPVVKVSWDDAQAFCAWLTERERKDARLGTTERYRLPTDHEWSCAVGIGEQEDPAKTPEQKSEKIPDVYPWGSNWPPPPGVGNYSGEEVEGQKHFGDQRILRGYRDNFPYTAPVGSFAANRSGIFDLGGNAREWCEDHVNPIQKARVLRGACYVDEDRTRLLSSSRVGGTTPWQLFGFRVVVSAAGPAR
jgi:heme-degrading monooxygenase HmoA